MAEELKTVESKKVSLIGNKSEGYNYKYTSLGDLVIAGVELPPMRVATLVDGEQNPIIVDGKPIEYIEALRQFADGNGNIREEWIRGARIVIPTGNKMNEAQAYGSALTYARRYTALTVLGLACEDDSKIEVHSKEESEEQQLANITKELKELYAKAGGKDFDKWCEDCGGLSIKNYMAMKKSVVKQLNEIAEKGGKK